MALEIRDMITPGHDKAFTVGERKSKASLSDLPAVHRALLESPALSFSLHDGRSDTAADTVLPGFYPPCDRLWMVAEPATASSANTKQM